MVCKMGIVATKPPCYCVARDAKEKIGAGMKKIFLSEQRL